MDRNKPLIEVEARDLRSTLSFAIGQCPMLPRLKARPDEPRSAAHDRLVEALVQRILNGLALNGWHVVRHPADGRGHGAGFMGWRPPA